MTQPPADLTTLLLGLGIFMVLATIVGQVLEKIYSPDGSDHVTANLNDRIRSLWIMIVLMAIALLFGMVGTTLLFAVCSFAALREVITRAETRRGDHWAVAASFFVVLPLQYYLIYIQWIGLYTILIPVYGFLLIPIIAVLRGDTNDFLSRISGVQWSLMICVYCISHVPALLSLDIPGYEGSNVILIAFLIIVMQAGEVAQYIWGNVSGTRSGDDRSGRR